MRVAVFVSVERIDGCVTTCSSIKDIEDINNIEEVNANIEQIIKNNRADKGWNGGKVEKIIINDIDNPYIPVLEEKNYPIRFNYLLNK